MTKQMMYKRIISAVLCIVMTLGSVPLQAFAVSTDGESDGAAATTVDEVFSEEISVEEEADEDTVDDVFSAVLPTQTDPTEETQDNTSDDESGVFGVFDDTLDGDETEPDNEYDDEYDEDSWENSKQITNLNVTSGAIRASNTITITTQPTYVKIGPEGGNGSKFVYSSPSAKTTLKLYVNGSCVKEVSKGKGKSISYTPSFSAITQSSFSGTSHTYYYTISDGTNTVTSSRATVYYAIPTISLTASTSGYSNKQIKITASTASTSGAKVTKYFFTQSSYSFSSLKSMSSSFSSTASKSMTATGTWYCYGMTAKGYITSSATVSVKYDALAPSVTSVTEGANSLTVHASDAAASGASCRSGIAGYYCSTSTSTPSASKFTSSTASSYTFTGLSIGKSYYVWVKDAAGNISSRAGAYQVKSSSSSSSSTPTYYILNPDSSSSSSYLTYNYTCTRDVGETYTLTAALKSGTATGATYQWQYSADGGSTWASLSGNNFSGLKTLTLTVNNPAASSSSKTLGTYRLAISGSWGTVYTKNVEVQLRTKPGAITSLESLGATWISTPTYFRMQPGKASYLCKKNSSGYTETMDSTYGYYRVGTTGTWTLAKTSFNENANALIQIKLPSSSGTYKLYFRAYNYNSYASKGSSSTLYAEKSITIKVDLEYPTITSHAASSSTSYKITASDTGGSGIDTWGYSTTANTFPTTYFDSTKTTYTFTDLTLKGEDYYFYVQDRAGNTTRLNPDGSITEIPKTTSSSSGGSSGGGSSGGGSSGGGSSGGGSSGGGSSGSTTTSPTIQLYNPTASSSFLTSNYIYTVDKGTTFTLKGGIKSSGSSITSYQWQYSTDGSSWSNLENKSNYRSGVTTSELQLINVQVASESGMYRLKASGSFGTVYTSYYVELRINTAPGSPTVSSFTQTGGSSSAITLKVTAGTTPYQRKRGSSINATQDLYYQIGSTSGTWTRFATGVTSGSTYTLTLSSSTVAGRTIYIRGYNQEARNTSTSTSCYAQTTKSGTDTIVPTVSNVTVGPSTLTVTASDYGGSGIAYYGVGTSTSSSSVSSWKSSTSSTYTFTGLTAGTSYYVYVKDGSGNISAASGPWVPTSTFKVELYKPDTTTFLTSDYVFLRDVSHSYTLTGAISSGSVSSSATYQWEHSKDGGTTWTALSATNWVTGVNTSTLSVSSPSNGSSYPTEKGMYRLAVTDGGYTARSHYIHVQLRSAPGSVTMVSSATDWANKAVTITVTAGSLPTLTKNDGTTDATLPQDLYYQIGGTGGSWTKLATNAAKGSTYTITVDKSGSNKVYVRAISQSSYADRGFDGKYAQKYVTVKIDTGVPTISNVTMAANGLTITAADAGSSGIAGYYAGISANAPSAGDAAWKESTDSTYTITGLTSGTSYYVFVKDAAGNISAASGPYVVNATGAPMIELYQPTENTTFLTANGSLILDKGKGYTLKGAVFANGISEPTGYYWEHSKDGGSTWTALAASSGVSGVATDTLTVTSATGDTHYGLYRLVASGSWGKAYSVHYVNVQLRDVPGAPTVVSTPSGWTNGAVTVKVTAGTLPSLLKGDGTANSSLALDLYYQIGSTSSSGWTLLKSGATKGSTYTITVPKTKTGEIKVYVRAYTQASYAEQGVSGLYTEVYAITKIEVTAPTVDSVALLAGGLKITASDTGGSGIAAYCVGSSTTAPTIGWEESTDSTYSFTNLTVGKTYYAFVRDAAGNVSAANGPWTVSNDGAPEIELYDPNDTSALLTGNTSIISAKSVKLSSTVVTEGSSAPNSYQWQNSTDGGNTWTNVSGKTLSYAYLGGSTSSYGFFRLAATGSWGTVYSHYVDIQYPTQPGTPTVTSSTSSWTNQLTITVTTGAAPTLYTGNGLQTGTQDIYYYLTGTTTSQQKILIKKNLAANTTFSFELTNPSCTYVYIYTYATVSENGTETAWVRNNVAVCLDADAPLITGVSIPSDGETYLGMPTVRLYVWETGGSGLDYCVIKSTIITAEFHMSELVEGSGYVDIPASILFTCSDATLSEIAFTFSFRDAAGNESIPYQVTVWRDTTTPDIFITDDEGTQTTKDVYLTKFGGTSLELKADCSAFSGTSYDDISTIYWESWTGRDWVNVEDGLDLYGSNTLTYSTNTYAKIRFAVEVNAGTGTMKFVSSSYYIGIPKITSNMTLTAQTSGWANGTAYFSYKTPYSCIFYGYADVVECKQDIYCRVDVSSRSWTLLKEDCDSYSTYRVKTTHDGERVHFIRAVVAGDDPNSDVYCEGSVIIKNDETAPSISAVENLSGGLLIKASDGNGSGIAGYYLSASSTLPDNMTDNDWISSTDTTYKATGLTVGTSYYIWTKDAVGNVSEVSGPYTVTTTGPSITVELYGYNSDTLLTDNALYTVDTGIQAILTSETTGATGDVTYQWQSSTDGATWTSLTDGTTMTGVTTSTLMLAASLTKNRLYRLAATCDGYTVYSHYIEFVSRFISSYPSLTDTSAWTTAVSAGAAGTYCYLRRRGSTFSIDYQTELDLYYQIDSTSDSGWTLLKQGITSGVYYYFTPEISEEGTHTVYIRQYSHDSLEENDYDFEDAYYKEIVRYVYVDWSTPTINGVFPAGSGQLTVDAYDGLSGIAGYCISTSATEPTSGWVDTTARNYTFTDLSSGTAYYVYVKDAVGYVASSGPYELAEQPVIDLYDPATGEFLTDDIKIVHEEGGYSTISGGIKITGSDGVTSWKWQKSSDGGATWTDAEPTSSTDTTASYEENGWYLLRLQATGNWGTVVSEHYINVGLRMKPSTPELYFQTYPALGTATPSPTGWFSETIALRAKTGSNLPTVYLRPSRGNSSDETYHPAMDVYYQNNSESDSGWKLWQEDASANKIISSYWKLTITQAVMLYVRVYDREAQEADPQTTCYSSASIALNIDKVQPYLGNCYMPSANSISVTQKATLKSGVAGYYIGTSSTLPDGITDDDWLPSTASSYTFTDLQPGTYYCYVKSGSGLVSGAAGPFTIGSSDAPVIGIYQLNSSTEFIIGESTWYIAGVSPFTITSGIVTPGSAEPTGYQWERSADWGETWTALSDDDTYSGVTTDALTIASASAYGTTSESAKCGGVYRLRAYGSWGETVSTGQACLRYFNFSTKPSVATTNADWTNQDVTITIKSGAMKYYFGSWTASKVEYAILYRFGTSGNWTELVRSKTQNASFSLTVPNTVMGTTTVQVRVYDAAHYDSLNGAAFFYELETHVKIETDAPRVIAAYKSASGSLHVEATDMPNETTFNNGNYSGIAAYYCSTSSTAPTDSSDWKAADTSNPNSYTFTGLTNGSTYYVWVKDAAGNVSECTSVQLVDAPVIDLYDPATGNTQFLTADAVASRDNSVPITLKGGVKSGSAAGITGWKWEISMDGGASWYAASSSPSTTEISSGECSEVTIAGSDAYWLFRLEATGPWGTVYSQHYINQGTRMSPSTPTATASTSDWSKQNVTISVKTGSTVPVTRLEPNRGGGTTNATYNVPQDIYYQIDSESDDGWILLQADVAASTTTTNPITVSTDGEHKVYIRSYHREAREADLQTKIYSSRTVTVKVDKTAPVIEQAYQNGSGIVEVRASDVGGSQIAGYYFTTSSTAPTGAESEWVATDATSYKATGLAKGSKYYIYAKDNAGNISTAYTLAVAAYPTIDLYEPAGNTGVLTQDCVYTANYGTELTVKGVVTTSIGGELTYQWQTSVDGNTWTDIDGQTDIAMTLSVTTPAIYRLKASGSWGTVYSQHRITIQVYHPPGAPTVVSVEPEGWTTGDQNFTIKAGSAPKLCTINGETVIQQDLYQRQETVNSGKISLIAENIQEGEEYTYKYWGIGEIEIQFRAYNHDSYAADPNTTDYTETIAIGRLDYKAPTLSLVSIGATSITVEAESLSPVTGFYISTSAEKPGADDADWIDSPDQTLSKCTYTFTDLTFGTPYYVFAKNAVGYVSTAYGPYEVHSDTAPTLNLYQPDENSELLSENYIVQTFYGRTVTLAGAIQGEVSTETVQFQWERSTDGGQAWAAISDGTVFSGATTEELKITVPQNYRDVYGCYRLVARDDWGTVYSTYYVTLRIYYIERDSRYDSILSVTPSGWTNGDVEIKYLSGRLKAGHHAKDTEINGLSLIWAYQLDSTDGQWIVLDGTSYYSDSKVLDIPITKSGTTKVYVRAYNSWVYQQDPDTIAYIETMVEVNIDKTLPVVSGAVQSGAGAVTVKARDAESGIAGYYITTDTTPPDAAAEWIETTDTTYTISGLTEGKTYYVYAKDAVGNVSSTYRSVTLVKSPVIDLYEMDDDGTFLTENLLHIEEVGERVTFKGGVKTKGAATPTWQWQVSEDAGETWTDLDGRTSTTATLIPVNGGMYRLAGKGDWGTVYSEHYITVRLVGAPGALEVVSVEPSGWTNVPPTVTVRAGSAPISGETGSDGTQDLYWQAGSTSGTWKLFAEDAREGGEYTFSQNVPGEKTVYIRAYDHDSYAEDPNTTRYSEVTVTTRYDYSSLAIVSVVPGMNSITITTADNVYNGYVGGGPAGYYISTSSAKPELDDPNWIDSTEFTYTFTNLEAGVPYYIYTKDVAGNVNKTAHGPYEAYTAGAPVINLYKPDENTTFLTSNYTQCVMEGVNAVTFKGGVQSVGGIAPTSYHWEFCKNISNYPWQAISDGDIYSGTSTTELTISEATYSVAGCYRLVAEGIWGTAYSAQYVRLSVNRIGKSTAKTMVYTEPSTWTNGNVEVKYNASAVYASYYCEGLGNPWRSLSYQIGTTDGDWTFLNQSVGSSGEYTVTTITEPGETQVYVRAYIKQVYDQDHNADCYVEDVVTVKIDRELPDMLDAVQSGAGSVTVTASDSGGSGIAGYYVGITDSAPEANAEGWIGTVASPYTITGLTEENTYYIYTKDAAGNVSSSCKEVSLVKTPVIDLYQPTENTGFLEYNYQFLLENGSAYTLKGGVKSPGVSDPTSWQWEFSADGGESWSAYTAASGADSESFTNPNGTSSGMFRLSATGTWGTIYSQHYITVQLFNGIGDMTLVSVTPDGWTNQKPTVTVKAGKPMQYQDNVGEYHDSAQDLYYKIGSASETWTKFAADAQNGQEYSFEVSEAGEKTVYIRAYDRTSFEADPNTESFTELTTVTRLDTSKPEITNVKLGQCSITVIAHDTVSSIISGYYIGTGTEIMDDNWIPSAQTTYTFSALEPGVQYYIFVKDAAGNISEPEGPYAVATSGAPIINLYVPSSDAEFLTEEYKMYSYYGQTVTLKGAVQTEGNSAPASYHWERRHATGTEWETLTDSDIFDGVETVELKINMQRDYSDTYGYYRLVADGSWGTVYSTYNVDIWQYDVTIHADKQPEIIPSSWTNDDVKVRVSDNSIASGAYSPNADEENNITILYQAGTNTGTWSVAYSDVSCGNSYEFNVPIAVSGETQVYVRVYNATVYAHDQDTLLYAEAVLTARVDKEPPTITNVVQSGSGTVTITASDSGGSGISGYLVTVAPEADADWIETTQSICTVTGLTNGKVYYAFVKDAAGNICTTGAPITLVETSVVEVYQPGAGSTFVTDDYVYVLNYMETYTLSGGIKSGSSDGLTYHWEHSKDGGTTWTDVTESEHISGAASQELTIRNAQLDTEYGMYRLAATSDQWGTVYSHYIHVQLRMPPTAPTITLDPDSDWTNVDVAVNVMAGAPPVLGKNDSTADVAMIQDIYYQIGGTADGGWSRLALNAREGDVYPVTIPNSVIGETQIYIRAVNRESCTFSADELGVGVVTQATVKIEVTAPVITYVVTSPGKLSVTATDEGGSGIGGYYCGEAVEAPDPDDEGWVASTDASHTFDGLHEGHEYFVFVKDAAGNISEVSGPWTVREIMPATLKNIEVEATTDYIHEGNEILVDVLKPGTSDYHWIALKSGVEEDGCPNELVYQWEYSGDDGRSWTPVLEKTGYIEGISTSELRINTADAALTGRYRLSAANSEWGTVYTDYIDLMFLGAPQPVSVPSKLLDWTNGDATITVTAGDLATVIHNGEAHPTMSQCLMYRIGNTDDAWTSLAENAEKGSTYTIEVPRMMAGENTVYIRTYNQVSYGMNEHTGMYSETTVTVRIDTTLPTVSNVTPGNCQLTVTAADDENGSGIAGYFCSTSMNQPELSDSNWISCNESSYTFADLTIGERYYVFVKDGADNISAAYGPWQVYRDGAPVVKLYDPADNSNFLTHNVGFLTDIGKTVLFKGTMENAEGDTSASYQWEISTNDGTIWTAIQNGDIYAGAQTNSLSISDLTQSQAGIYRLSVTGAWGTVYSECSIELKLREIPGTPRILSIEPSDWSNEDVVVTIATGTAPSNGGQDLFYQIGGELGTWIKLAENAEAGASYSITVPNTEEGEIPVHIRAYNHDSYREDPENDTYSQTIAWAMIDTTAPSILSVTSGAEQLTVTATDEGGSGIAAYYCSTSAVDQIGGEWWGTYDSEVTFTELSIGVSYYLYVKDLAGNISSASGPWQVHSSAAPTIDLYQPGTSEFLTADYTHLVTDGTSVTLQGGVINGDAIEEGYRWEVSTDGGKNWTAVDNKAPYSGVSTNSLSISNFAFEQTGMYRLTAVNSVWGTIYSSHCITLSLWEKPGTPTVVKVDPADWTNGNVVITVKAGSMTTASGQDLMYQVGGTDGAWMTFYENAQPGNTYTLVISKNEAGMSRVYIRAYDRESFSEDAGTDRYSGAWADVKIDATIPVITTATASGTDIMVTALDEGGSGIAGYYCSTSNGTPLLSGPGWKDSNESSFTFSDLTEGETYHIYVKDAAGNLSEMTTVTLEGTPSEKRAPTINLFQPGTEHILSDNFILESDEYETVRIQGQIKLNNCAEPTNYNWQWYDGTQWVDLEAEDGNYEGVNTLQLAIVEADSSQTGLYRLTASNDEWGSVASDYYVGLKLFSAPGEVAVVSVDPSSWTNGDVTITVKAGKSPMVYFDTLVQEASQYLMYQIGGTDGEWISFAEGVTRNESYTLVIPKTESGQNQVYIRAVNYAAYEANNSTGMYTEAQATVYIDSVAPEITGVVLGDREVTVEATDAGGSGIVAWFLGTTPEKPLPDNVHWKDGKDSSHVFSDLELGKTYYFFAMDKVGNVSQASEPVKITLRVETNASLDIEDGLEPSVDLVDRNDNQAVFSWTTFSDEMQAVLNGYTFTHVSVTGSEETSLVAPQTVVDNYGKYGTIKANSELGLTLLAEDVNEEDKFEVPLVRNGFGDDDVTELRNVIGIRLYNAAAYNVTEDRVFTITLSDDDGNTAIITLTVKGITGKQLILDVPVNQATIQLEPGIKTESTSTAVEMKNQNAYPLALTMSSVTAETEITPVVRSDIQVETDGEFIDLLDAGVKLGIKLGDDGITQFYTPGNTAEVTTLVSNSTLKLYYILQYSPLYTGSEQSFSYKIGYSFSIPDKGPEEP